MNNMSNAPFPEWAVTFVRGALRMGMNVQEIEQHLIAKGMTPSAAKGLVMEIVEAAFVATAEPIGSSEWGKPIRLFLATTIAGVCVFLAYWYGGQASIGHALLFVLPALLGTYAPEIPDLEEVGWAMAARFSGWVLLFIYLAYRIFILAMWP